MKISSLLVATEAANSKNPRRKGVEESRTPFINCGEYFYNEEEARIQSPSWPSSYPNNTFCVWLVENECAESFTVTPLAFALEQNPRCAWDKLEITVDGADEKTTYCGGGDGPDDFSSFDYSYYSSSYYGYDDLDLSEFRIHGMVDPFTVEGNQLQLQFLSDSIISLEGFDLRITPNTKSGCIPGVRPEAECRPNIKFPTAAVYKTSNEFDLAVPFSDYNSIVSIDAASSNLNDECIEKCIDTAGCFKVKRRVDLNKVYCDLRGHELNPSQSNTFAVNGRHCEDDGRRIWIDGKSETKFSCLFSLPEYADNYLEYLKGKNQAMLEWVSTNSDDAMTNQVLTSKKWSFAEAENRNSNHGVWYTFHSVTYYRQFLSDNGRKRRDVDSNALFQSVAQELAAEFVNDLDIGDVGATVLETEDPVIFVDILEEVAQPQDVEFAASFDAVEKIIHDAVMALPKWNNVKGLEWSRKRFGWFSDFSDAPCFKYAGKGVGAGIDYEPPTVDAEDPCSTIVSFHTAILGYYDDFVCLDRSDENPFGKKRMETRMKHLLNRSKVHYNRFLKKLSCEQRIHY